jgi:Polyketide cyclase / dehydrase and lipid transport
MPDILIAESLVIPAPASLLYEIIADYRSGHPSILPAAYFGRLDVLEGGRGAGTKVRFEVRAFGRLNVDTAEVSEPVPGRELRETLPSGIVTTFLVEPLGATESRVTIRTEFAKPGLRGWFERLLATPYFRRVYAAELAQLARVAADRLRCP